MAQQYINGEFVSSTSWMRKKLPNDAPIHAASSTLVSELLRQFGANPSGGPGLNYGPYGIGSVTVASSDPVRTMHRLNDGLTWQFRLPDAMPVPSGTDGSVVIWDPTADAVIEGWQVRRYGADWACTWGGYNADVSAWDGLYSNHWGIAAAGTSFLSQMLTIDDMRRATIGHTIGIAIAHNYGFTWPANRTDGHGGKPGNPIKMGQRFRFPANINLGGLSAPARKITEAIRDHGLSVLDTTAQPSETYPLWCQINAEKDDHGHYASVMGSDPNAVVRSLPWNQIVALPDAYDGGTVTDPPIVVEGLELTSLTLAKVGSNAGGDIVRATWVANKNAASWTAHIKHVNAVEWSTVLDGSARQIEFWNVAQGAIITISSGSVTRSATYSDTLPANAPPTPGALETIPRIDQIEAHVNGAADAEGLHATPYAYRLETAGVWSGWTAWGSLSGTVFINLQPSTTYRVQHKVRDAAGQEVEGTAATVTTLAELADVEFSGNGTLTAVGGMAGDGTTPQGTPMGFPTAVLRENASTGAVAAATHVALFATEGTATPGAELSGGDYARQPAAWNHGTVDGRTTTTATFAVPPGTTVRGYGLYTAETGGTYLGGGALPEQVFTPAGEYELTVTVRMRSTI